MIERRQTVAQERAAWLTTWQEYYPEFRATFLVAVEPTDPRFQAWMVGAYPTLDYALLIANGEREMFATCPPNWVDVTVEEIELAPQSQVGATPILVELPMLAPAERALA